MSDYWADALKGYSTSNKIPHSRCDVVYILGKVAILVLHSLFTTIDNFEKANNKNSFCTKKSICLFDIMSK